MKISNVNRRTDNTMAKKEKDNRQTIGQNNTQKTTNWKGINSDVGGQLYWWGYICCRRKQPHFQWHWQIDYNQIYRAHFTIRSRITCIPWSIIVCQLMGTTCFRNGNLFLSAGDVGRINMHMFICWYWWKCWPSLFF